MCCRKTDTNEKGRRTWTVEIAEHKLAAFGPAELTVAWPTLVDALEQYSVAVREHCLNGKDDKEYFFPSSQTGDKMSHDRDALTCIIGHIRKGLAKRGEDEDESLETLTMGAFRKAFATLGYCSEEIGLDMADFLMHDARVGAKHYLTSDEKRRRVAGKWLQT